MAEGLIERLREVRVREPGSIAAAAARRERRPVVGADGKLFLVAADHPARGALAVGDRSMAMADRAGLLERLCVALARPGVDGVLATADILEDLLLLGALEGKVAIGSMNRGGVRGSVFELDDRFTGYDVATIRRMGLDGGKMLCRIAPDDPATAATLEACGRAVTALAESCLLAMIEPFWTWHQHPGEARNDLSTESVVRSATVTSALGATSAYTWLKLPVAAEMERVVAATSLPVLVLGGDLGSGEEEPLAAFERVLGLPGVRGLAAGRTLLYPGDGDVAGAVDAAARLLGRVGSDGRRPSPRRPAPARAEPAAGHLPAVGGAGS